jgi:hypothetical protein
VRQRDQAGDVVDADVEALDLVARDARVAGRRDDIGVLRAAQQRANERVLAPSRADDQDLLAQSDAMKSSTGIAGSVS